MLRRLVIAASMLMVLSLGSLIAVPGVARATSAGTPCPGYVDHLRRARAYLKGGQRTAAVTELRRASNALGRCIHEEASEDSLLAAHGLELPTG
jgi:hypothetical protein